MTREEIAELLMQDRAPAQITVNPMKQRIERKRDYEDASTYEYDPFNPDTDPRGPPPVMGGYPVAGVVPKQALPPSFALPAAAPRQNMLERNLPPAYDPLSRTQQAVGSAAFDFTPMGAIAELYDTARSGDETGFGLAAATAFPAARAAKAGKKVLEKGLAGFALGSAADVTQYANPKLRAQAELLRGKYPQYAEDYPPVGPPDLIAKPPDPDRPGAFLATGGKPVPYKTMDEALAKDAEPGFYLGKKKLPEVEQFQKDRAAIQKDMDLHGYDRYFDPAKRSDVDPKHYGPFDDTGTAAAPKTAAKDIEWSAKYGTPENRAKLQEGHAKGQTIKDSSDWYFMGQLEKEYIKELGPKAGREAFKREFGDMMAATTGGANPYDNFLMSQYANVMTKRGERLPERSYDMPFPIGGQYASGNIAQARKYIEAGQKGFDPAVNPKRYDFSSAFQGNKNAATIDEQMYGALRPKGAPASEGLPTWYGPATRVAREEAQKAGVDPRGFQDVTWAGLKSGKVEAKGQKFDYEGPMIEHINRSIETTSRLTGMSPAEVVKRGLIRKEIPMYGLIGAGAMGALARQDEYRQ